VSVKPESRLSLASAAQYAADLQVVATEVAALLCRQVELPGSTICEIADRTLGILPDAARIVRAASPLPQGERPQAVARNGVINWSSSDQSFFEVGRTVGGVPFGQGQRGTSATVYAALGRRHRVECCLVPERASGWVPVQDVPYRVRLVRQIGQGRRQVWTCRPLDAAVDEERERLLSDGGYLNLQAAIRTAQKALNSLAASVVREFVGQLKLPEEAGAKYAAAATAAEGYRQVSLPLPKWEWRGDPEVSDETSYGGGSRLDGPQRRALRGRRACTWGGASGVYCAVVYQRQAEIRFESADGGSRLRLEWRESGSEKEVFVEGVDVLALRERVQNLLRARTQKADTEAAEAKKGLAAVAERLAADLAAAANLPHAVRGAETQPAEMLAWFIQLRLGKARSGFAAPTIDELLKEAAAVNQ
jgi:hypothetical protein